MNRLLKASLPLVFAAFALVFAPAALAQVAGQNVNMVSGTSWPGGDPFLQRQNEPSMAVSTRNPMHILAGANDYRTVDLELALSGGQETGDSWLGLFKSFDGGLTWRSTLLPGCKYLVSDCRDSNGARVPGTVLTGVYDAGSDPVVRAGTNGMFYYAGLAFDRNNTSGASQYSTIFVARYNDLNNNENIDPIRYVDTRQIASGNQNEFLDKPALAVDIPRAGASLCTITTTQPGSKPADPPISVTQQFPAGNVYITYTDFTKPTKDNGTPTHLLFKRSTNCGVDWYPAVQLNTGDTTSQGSAIAVNPVNGNVYVTWRQFASSGVPDAIMMAQSTNGGHTFSAPVRISTFQPFDQLTKPSEFRTNAYPSITTDMFGFVYVAFSARGLGPSGDARVVVSGSIDGTHWTPPIMVDNPSKNAQTNPSGRGHQIMPAITFANGRLTLLYYDLRLDHYEYTYTSNGQGSYLPTLNPEGELPANPNAVFTPLVDDAGLNLRRHTIDLRVLQLGIFPTVTLGPSVSVSQYDYGCCANGSQEIQQFKFNVPNLPLFALGTQPFLGDYIEVVPSPLFVPNGNSWAYNFKPSVNPLFHATWTDNRDVIPPADGRWDHYTPAVPNGTPSVFQNGQTVNCTAGQEGMRNQNIYTSQITGGLIVGAPGNFKQLGNMDGSSRLFQRAFAVEAQNVTNQAINVRFSIANQPPGGKASFNQFLQLTALDITIPALSSVSRSVFVTSTNAKASVTVNVVQIGSVGGSPVTNGLSSSAVLNPDVSNPNITNPNVTNLDPTNPNITNSEVTNPNVTNPNITNPNVTNPNITNPNVTNPNITNPNVTNPNITNPDITNPNVTNPNITNPNITNPNITNPNITNDTISNGAIQDVTYSVTNQGNTTSSYTVQVAELVPAGSSQLNGVGVQLIVNRLYQTPSANNCKPTVQTHWITVANIINPKLYDLSDPSQRSQVGNPNITNSTPNEASVTLAPGETAYITLRVISPTTTPVNPLALFAPVTFPQAVNTQTVLANPGVTVLPPVVFPPPTILTAALPQSDLNDAGYSLQFSAAGGKPGAATWTVDSGALPNSLTLSTTGLLSGTPTQIGSFPVTIKATDGAGRSNTKSYTLVINPTPFVLSGEGGIPSGTINQLYGPVSPFTNGGTAPFSWTISGAPAGIGIDPSTGVVSGTPSVSGTFNAIITARDSATPPVTASLNVSIVISGGVPVPGKVIFVTQPPNYIGGQANPNSPIKVHVQDSAGLPVAGADVLLSFNGIPPCAEAALGGTVMQKTVEGGDAFFGNLSVDRGQIGYTLTATATVAGVPPASANSNAFTVNGFCASGPATVARSFPTATLLPDGTVLVAGGQVGQSQSPQGRIATSQAELYNPSNGTFAQTVNATTAAVTSMTTQRLGHTATLLNNGKVLIVGGQQLTVDGVFYLSTAEIYDPVSGTFSSTAGDLTTARSGHTATLLADGTVLIAGGFFGNTILASAELYDPGTKTFSTVGPMNAGRRGHTATLLDNGKVLMAGGLDNTAELYNPVAKTFSTTGNLSTPRQNPSATLLSNGKALIAGGLMSNGATGIGTAELYDPVAGTFSFTSGGLSTARGFHSAALLPDGTVLLAGGYNDVPPFTNPILGSAEIYNPSTDTFSNTGSLTGTRWQHTATLLNDGSVLIAGGFGFNSQANSNSFLASADRYFSTAPLSPIAFTTYQGIPAGTTVSSNSSAFGINANGMTNLGFNGILNGAPFLSFNPLVVPNAVSNVTFTGTNANVNVTKNNNYPSNIYPVDFIVDSANSNATNSVTIILSQPVTALGIDYGGLGPGFGAGPFTGSISLSNGFVLPLSTLPTVGQTQFNGFVSSTPFTSLTYTVNGNHWVVTDLLLAKANVTLPTGSLGNPYTYILQEQGGVGPLNWTVTAGSGSLPPGLSLSLSGIISGTPTTAGLYTFTVTVTDGRPKSVTSGTVTINVPSP